MSKDVNKFVDNVLARAIRPIKRLTVSEWADENRELSSVASAEPGRWRTSRTPYLRDIMDALGAYSDFDTVVFKKGSQVGATEAGFNMIGYYIDTDPCPIMAVMPTEAGVRKNSTTRFDPMVRAAASLRAKVAPEGVKRKQNSILQKAFPGGVLIFCGANSAAPLRSTPVRVLILDEVDNMPNDVAGEGSPIDLATARTRTFSRKKIFILSTPTKEGASQITAEYENTDQRKYFVPCPHCGLFQTLEFEQLHWDPGQYETARYVCNGCDEAIEERHKPFMLSSGEWRATKPENTRVNRVGFFLSSLYSPLGWLSWANIASEWEAAKGNPDKEMVFTNTILGEAYSEKGEVPEWKSLYARRENYPVYSPPADVVLLTAGVDVQKDRLEVEIVGWCPGRRSYSVDYRVLPGDTADQPVWDELAKVVDDRWVRTDGRELLISRMCIDSGYNTNEVYAFCRRFDPSRVVPTKGNDNQNVVLSPPKPVDRSDRSGKTAGVTMLWSIGVNILKSELYGWLRLTVAEDGSYPPGYCHFPTAYDEHYFKMLTAEAQVKKIIRGYPVYVWEKKFPRNEALDCRVLARAAAEMLGVSRWRDEDWRAWAEQLQVRTKPPEGETTTRRGRSSFWDR